MEPIRKASSFNVLNPDFDFDYINDLVSIHVIGEIPKGSFNPTRDMNHALFVADEMHGQGYRFLVTRCSPSNGTVKDGISEVGDYFCNMIQDSDEKFGQAKSTSIVTAKTAQMAICISALQALGVRYEN